MNMCTDYKSRLNLSNGLPNFTPDRKLASVETILQQLIESRFGPEFTFDRSTPINPDAEPVFDLNACFIREQIDDDDLLDLNFIARYQFARPFDLAEPSNAHAKGFSCAGARTVAESEIFRTQFAKFFSASIQPRGSPPILSKDL